MSDSNSLPLVSVIINCFNGGNFIELAIQSVLKQTYTNYELIIWDNQSTDNSKEIIDTFNDKRVRYYYSNEHSNLYKARNMAAEKSKGEYITFLDCDDWWEPTKLEKQISKFAKDDYAIVYCNQRLIFDKKTRFGNVFDKLVCKALSRNHITDFSNKMEGRILNEVLDDYKVGIATVMIKKSYFTDFDDRFHIIGDFEFVIRTCIKHKIGYINEILASYRIHGFNESFKHRKLQISELETWYEETKKNHEISKFKSFENLKFKIIYLKAMDCIGDKNYKFPIKCILTLPLKLWKLRLRLLIILLSPSIIVKIFRT